MIFLFIAKLKPQIIYWLFFCLVIISLFGLLPGQLGLLVLFILFVFQCILLRIVSANYGINISRFLAPIFLLAYYLISLTAIYYISGLTRPILAVYFLINHVILFPAINNLQFFQELSLSSVKNELTKLIKSPTQILALISIIIIFIIIIIRPVLDGDPSPWTNFPTIGFFIFLGCTFILIADYSYKNYSTISTFLYYLLALSLVAIKYKLSYGFDTIIHQASLNQIANTGKILPLTPFYIGQYVIELVFHFFGNLDFTLIERFLIPIFFVLLTFLISEHFFISLKLKAHPIIIPIAALFLIPDQFFYSTPYALALIWAIIFSISLYIYLKQPNKIDFYLMIISAIATILIHPFVGLPFIFIILGALNYQRTKYKKLNLFVTFISSSLIIFLCFTLFNIIVQRSVSLANPLSSWTFLVNIFTPPVWFNSLNTSLFFWLIYTYERFFLLILGMIIAGYCLSQSKKRLADTILIILSLSFIISSWLFISAISISGYTYADQMNYSYRLIQISRWLLWPIWLMIFYYLFTFINSLRFWKRLVFLTFISLLICLNWYLTYPRNDEVSHMSINSIRQIDYDGVNLIYSMENGKTGYLVLANQLFGAAAVKTYGFGPYYQTPWGNLLYYSIPMSSEFHTRYEQITSENFFDYHSLAELMESSKVNRLYLIFTDYWQPEETTKAEIKSAASQYWNIGEQIEIYQFNLAP